MSEAANSLIRQLQGVAAMIHYGAGTPEGNVAAPVGHIYLRSDGGAGSTFYVKETGTADTGWSPK